MEPESLPWRTIDAASSAAPTEPVAVPTNRSTWSVSTGTLAVAAAIALIAVAAFVLAFGATGTGTVGVAGAQVLDPAAGGSPGALAGIGDPSRVDVVVEIVGAVVRPGVYHLPAGSRVDDLLVASGGFGPRVDTDGAAQSLNRAAVLTDGAKIRVPSRDDVETATPSGPGSGGGNTSGQTLIELNTATASELDTLPGIGPVTADKIITARDEAPFTAVEDLRTRKLVGEKTFDGLKDLVTVR